MQNEGIMQSSPLCLLGDKNTLTEDCPKNLSAIISSYLLLKKEDIQDDSKMYYLVRLETQIYL